MAWLGLAIIFWKPAYYAYKYLRTKEVPYKISLQDWFSSLWHLISPKV